MAAREYWASKTQSIAKKFRVGVVEKNQLGKYIQIQMICTGARARFFMTHADTDQQGGVSSAGPPC